MSIATFESPKLATQRFFAWDSDNEVDCGFSIQESAQESAPADAVEPELVCQQPVKVAFEARLPENQRGLPENRLPALAIEGRLAAPVRIGAVMLRLLRSYGITDEEIAEGVAAYAAKTGLVQAG